MGLRAESSKAPDLHRLVRPDTIYLASGPRRQFLAGPMPFGTDRQSLTKAFKELQWDIKPLQPVTSIAGKGSMWLVISIDDPPKTWFQMDHGEVVITRHRVQDSHDRDDSVKPVASAATLQLCGNNGAKDPWQTGSDPWQQYATPNKEQSYIIYDFFRGVVQQPNRWSKIPAIPT